MRETLKNSDQKAVNEYVKGGRRRGARGKGGGDEQCDGGDRARIQPLCHGDGPAPAFWELALFSGNLGVQLPPDIIIHLYLQCQVVAGTGAQSVPACFRN